jgi:CBS domain containing-hemolysin-like protein
MIWNFILILILVVLNGFFVAAEFAVITARKTRVRLLAEQGNSGAQLVLHWLEDPAARDKLIAAAQLGITIVSLALGAVGENTFEALLEPVFHSLELPVQWTRIEPILASLPLVISLIIVTSLHVVFGEQVPKVAALESPETIAVFSATPMHWFNRVFSWFVNILDWATQSILRLFGVKSVGGGHSLIYTVDELKEILSESEQLGTIESPQREMLHAVFDFNRLLVRQVMIPRTEIIAIPANMNLDDSINIAINTSHSKFPVYDGNLDNITGIIHIKDLMRAKYLDTSEELPIEQLDRDPIVVPESCSVRNLLNLFQEHNRHLAIVLDEYGGTAGLVTLEDLLEEIVGDITDPFDTEASEVIRLDPDTVVVDGLATIDHVNLALGTTFEDENYDTIAGFLLGYLDHVPAIGEEINLSDGVQMQVTEMDGLRISKIQIRGV